VAALLGASIPHDVALAVNAGNEHGAAVLLATRLVGQNLGWRIFYGSDVSQRFIEATVTKFIGATEVFHGIVEVVGRNRELHGAKVLVAQR
jgi:hypothetical protein